MTPELEATYRKGLTEAIEAGYSILRYGAAAVDAVKVATMVLENNILFNAGKGSVFTKEGLHEMDAAIMDGSTLEAGAVAGVRNIRNPVELAAEVMINSDHVFLSGWGANEFASKQGILSEPDEYFFSQIRYDQWKAVQGSDDYILDHSANPGEADGKKFGTVGAVACDKFGNIAAATSTGGMTNKKYGRVGDSPLIGCGIYANNRTCAISCTGHGELFIRAVAAFDVNALMEYKGMSLEEAMEEVVFQKLKPMGGEGGMIGVDALGNAAMIFNSEGMYRAMRCSDGREVVAIYGE